MILDLYYVGCLVAFPVLVLSCYAYFQSRWPILADEERNADAWKAIAVSLIGTIGWPVVLPMSYLMYNFYRYGFRIPWSPLPKEEDDQ